MAAMLRLRISGEIRSVTDASGYEIFDSGDSVIHSNVFGDSLDYRHYHCIAKHLVGAGV